MDSIYKDSTHLDTILKSVSSLDHHNFKNYFGFIFKDLYDRSHEENQLDYTISNFTFNDYLGLPLIITDRIFNAFDKNRLGALGQDDFVEGLNSLYFGDIGTKLKLSFDIFDFDGDGKITVDDIILLFSHFHKKANCSSDIQTLTTLIEKSLKGKSTFLSYDDYTSIVYKSNSDLFILLICFLWMFKPVDEATITFFNSHFIKKETITKSLFEKERVVIQADLAKPTYELLQYLSNNLNYNFIYGNEKENEEEMNSFDSFNDEMVGSEWKIFVSEPIPDSQENILDKNLNFDLSPTAEATKLGLNTSLGNLKSLTSSFSKMSINGSNLSLEAFNKPYLDNKNSSGTSVEHNYHSNSKDIDISLSMDAPTNEFYVFKQSKLFTFKKYKLIIMNNNIYYFKLKDLEYKFKGIHVTKTTCIEKYEAIEKEGLTVFPVQFISFFNMKSIAVTYYCSTKEDLDQLSVSFKTANKFKRFQEFYDLKEELGHGQFGKVRLAVDKNTNEKFAVKLLRKKNLNKKDAWMVKWEIEIFKFLINSPHPAICKALKFFESANTFYFLFENLSGGALSTAIKEKNFDMNDYPFILPQIADGLKFLHSYGIIHRDVKPENILFTSTEKKSVKMIDFGLSKIQGRFEKTKERYGSLCYVAPEILLKQPYDFSVDIWSYGIMVYQLYYKKFPFDDDESDLVKISKKIIKGSYEISSSVEAKVNNIINVCLQIKPSKRITSTRLVNLIDILI